MKIEFCGLSAEFTRQGLWLPCDADQPPEEQWGVYANKSNLVNALSRRALARSTVPRTIKLKHRSWRGQGTGNLNRRKSNQYLYLVLDLLYRRSIVVP